MRTLAALALTTLLLGGCGTVPTTKCGIWSLGASNPHICRGPETTGTLIMAPFLDAMPVR